MGYDMHWVRRDPEEVELLAAARARLDAARAARSVIPKEDPAWEAAQAEVMRAAGERNAAERSYFRLNIWGMQECSLAMDAFGMLCYGDHPKFPRLADYGITSEEHEKWQEVLDSDALDPASVVPEPVLKFELEHRRVLSYHPEGERGIPTFKFGTNDGWVVTPEEITQALDAYAQAKGQQHLVESGEDIREISWWNEWIDWLKGAAEHGGFVVY